MAFRAWWRVSIFLIVIMSVSPALAQESGDPSETQAVMTFTVTSTNDANDGTCNASHCSLREAINASNANPDKDTIAFNISDTPPFTIQPSTPLPLILNSVIIDGTAQPGFSGAPLIVLNGSNYTAPAGQEITAVGINILSGGSTLRGLVLNGWKYGGVGMPTGSGNIIEGNYIGTNAAGTAAVPNLYGVIIASSANNTIGGTTAAARNIISGNNDDGVNIFGQSATNNVVIGNYIGTDVTGTLALGNGDDGVKIEDSTNNRVGGTTAAERNVIAHSLRNGVILKGATTSNNLIQGNTIGTDVTGTLDLGNRLHGVFVEDAPNNTIGGTASGAGNLIAYNDFAGVNVATGTGNLISSNSIFANGSLGIDLGGNGVTANDADDSDAGANNLQNFPILTGATASNFIVNITGILNSTANTTFRLEFFAYQNCDKSGYGEGKIYLGSANASTDGSGQVNFNANFDYQAAYGTHLSVTAIDPNNNSSEFSACYKIGSNLPGCPGNQNVVVSFNNWMAFGVVNLEINNSGPEYVQLRSFGIRWIQRAPGVLTLDQVTVGGANPGDPLGKIVWQSGSPIEDANPPTIASTDPTESEGNWLFDYVFPPNSITPMYLDFGGTTTTLPFAFGSIPADLNGTWFDLICLDRNRPPRADLRGVDANGVLMAENEPIIRTTDGAGSVLFVTMDGREGVTGTSDPDGMIVRYLWTINGVVYADGDEATAGRVTLQLGPGTYPVVLTVYDNEGASDDDLIFVTINLPTPASFTVNTTADTNDGVCDAQCSLREAITLSNSTSGKQVILFNIPGAAPYTIQPTSALPTITDPVIIDGWSEPDFAGSPIIELNGNNGTGGGTGIYISAGNSTVRGLVINRFYHYGLSISGNGNIIQGNYLGTNVAGDTRFGLTQNGLGINANNTLVGTNADGVNDATERNVIVGNSGTFVLRGLNNVVAGNYIGTDVTGTQILSESNFSIGPTAQNNLVGTNADGVNDATERNVIVGGIFINEANENIVAGNYIGTDVSGMQSLGEHDNYIEILGNSSDNTIGGISPASSNLIRTAGVQAPSGMGNAILGNSIINTDSLGINLSNDGVTPNDPGDTDTGPNNLQNFPVLTTASKSGSSININGTLNGAANSTYRVEFFANDACDPSGYGEGETFIGATNVTTNGSGNVSFNVEFAFPASVGQYVTATATDPNNNTSEFSQCLEVIPGNSANDVPERNAFPTTDVTLTWNSISWATGYQIEIATDAQFSNIEDVLEIPSGQLSRNWTAPNSGKYYWRVRAKDANNIGQAWSKVDSFVVMP
jgi:CSLREA domain-containing protein